MLPTAIAASHSSNLIQRINNFRASTLFTTVVISCTIFVDQIFFTIILPVLPDALPNRFGVHQDKIQYWTSVLIALYGAATLVSSAPVGWWTDRNKSRRIPFLISVVVLVAAVLLMWLPRSLAAQIVSRLMQGTATTMIYITGMCVMVDKVGTKHIAEYMGHIACAMNVGSLVGPLLGGVVYEKAGYNAVWGVMMGFVALDVVLRFSLVETERESISTDNFHTSYNSSDDTIVVAEASVKDQAAQDEEHAGTKRSLLQQQTEECASRPNTSSTISESLSPKQQQCIMIRSKLPPVLTLLTSIRMNTALFATVVQGLVFSGFETVLALYMEDIWHYTPPQSGLFFIAFTVPGLISPFLGRFVDKSSPKWSLGFGFLLLCPLLVLVRFVDHNSIKQKVLLAALLFFIGLGIAATLGPLMAEISHVVQEAENRDPKLYKKDAGAYAQAFSLFNAAWAFGNLVGPLMAGLIRDSYGWGTMGWTLGLLCGVTCCPCLIWSGGSIFAGKRHS